MSRIRTALISVSDKSDINIILKVLKKFNITIISSGGTFKKIKKLGYKCIEVSEYTDFKEILSGRVKTLHPKIHAGILADRNNNFHRKDLFQHGYLNIDLVIVNFYPFEKVLKKRANHEKIIENIDIGGPTMVRAAAKNYKYVTVLTLNNQYRDFKEELLKNKGSTTLSFRKRMAESAFIETSCYDASISDYFNKLSKESFPYKKIIFGTKFINLRYGENPHQKAAVYLRDENRNNIEKLTGKDLSFNNYNDVYAALSVSKTINKDFTSVIVKHGNPCGVSISKSKIMSYKSALSCDPISAFGGIVSFNFIVNKKLALELKEKYLEVIIAEDFDKDALLVLKKKENLRLIRSKNVELSNYIDINNCNNNLLFQSPDLEVFNKKNFKVVSKIRPSKEIMQNLIFAFNVCRFVKSNAIVLTKDLTTVGIGSGQSSRVDSCEIAINKMKKLSINMQNLCAASDAFFPFVDGIEKLVQSGVKAVVQPSGSIRDKEIIKFANKMGVVLVFSKTRHFKH